MGYHDIKMLADGSRSSVEIAEQLGVSARYVRKVLQKHDLPRLNRGAQPAENNHQYRGGRMVDLDGYVLTSKRPHQFEHRLVMAQTIGRDLLPTEVVDHIDGLTLHNDPANLRLFQSNGDHLRATLTGRPKRISKSGRTRILSRQGESVDIHRRRKARGDVRLLAILRLALTLGTDSPYLSGSRRWLRKAGVDPYSRRSLALCLDSLLRRYEQDLAS